jgi:hypothetical protein
MTPTLFSWGYHGWGNHTKELVKAVDAVETGRGFQPPFFVDIRYSRSVRAAGFRGPAFETLLGEERYLWMKSLGNKAIVTGRGPDIQIAEPEAAEKLLNLALKLSRHKQRLIFFCGCAWPKWDGEIYCHRTEVVNLVLKAATKRGIHIKIVEWPGGEPKRITLDLRPEHFTAVKRGRKTIPLVRKFDLAELAGLPWCSLATLRSDDETLHRIVGPAVHQTGGWVLPVLGPADDPTAGLKECGEEASKMRNGRGLEAVLS